ncbi:MAG TPA: rhomboid family intramembrane serine protease [Opitutaceae bacterium]|nr:rhomboid family intramembrane serine protease [Opitutaceae bacterium]
MNGSDYSENHQPIRWIGTHPIYLAHYVAFGFGLSMVLTAILSALGLSGVLSSLYFQSWEVFHGQLWRILTYGWVNPPSLWFVLELLMIVWFGREVEKFFGRRQFLALYAGLYLIPPAVHALAGVGSPVALAGESGGFGLFIAFAVLYPDAAIFFTFLAKWVAVVLIGVYSLEYLAAHDWLGLVDLAAETGFAFLFVRYQQGRIALPSFSRPARSAPPPREMRPTASSALVEADALLDKVARSGLSSLTAKERARLDAAREELKRRGGR